MVDQNLDIKIIKLLDFPGSPVLKTCAAKVGSAGSIPGRELRPHMLCGTVKKKTFFKCTCTHPNRKVIAS